MADGTRQAMNAQIVHEFESEHLYLQLSAWFEEHKLPGFAHWMKVQAQEERGHGMKFFQHLVDRDWEIRLGPIGAPPAHFETVQEVAQAVLDNERHVTHLIGDLVETAVQEHDHAAKVLLDWFVTEQVEEEASADQLLADVRLAGDDATALLYLDGRLAARGGEA
ncbi:MAG: ferritin [Candidatus Dormibacteraceae bacterium]